MLSHQPNRASIIEPQPQRSQDYIFSVTLFSATNSNYQKTKGQVPGYPSAVTLIPSNLDNQVLLCQEPRWSSRATKINDLGVDKRTSFLQ